jgi:hypothetical protein
VSELSRLIHLSAWAQRSRRPSAAAEPAPLTAADALALASEIADEIGRLDPQERLAFLSGLEDIQSALAARERRLTEEMAEAAGALRRLDRSREAHRGYQALTRPARGPRG